jgi:hypothetical protein
MGIDSFRTKAASFAGVPRFVTKPFRKMLKGLPLLARGYEWQGQWIKAARCDEGQLNNNNPLRMYFESLKSGPGIWKWDH